MVDSVQRDAARALAEEAARALPDVPVDPAVFAELLLQKGEDALPTQDAANSLLLVQGCLMGHDAAIRRFYELYTHVVDSALGKLRLQEANIADLRQATFQKLLVGAPDKPPKIADYAGRGPLSAWLRVTATRVGLRSVRRKNLEDGDDKLALGAAREDPELSYMKAIYRDAFRDSFRAAFSSLDARDRNILRQSLLDRLSIDELGALYGVHRATASRWIVAAKELLAKRTREDFVQRAKVPQSECDSILRMVQSRLDVTFRTVVAPDP